VSAVGLDLIEVARVERALERRPRLAARLFTPAERAYAESRARPAMHLAGRFCAKEAVAKSLGLRAWKPQQIEVVATAGAPQLMLRGEVASRARELGAEVRISITHTRETAAAVAVLDRASDSESA
jgi:holo-[acyl-carrier protein] synthase